MFYGWGWIALIVIAIITEALTDQLISIWFVPGSIVAIILDFFNINILWQILSVLLFATAGIVFAKTLLNKIMPTKIIKTNVEAIIGEKCIVTEKVDNYAGCGQVKIKGQIWSARSVDENETFNEGDILHVVAIEGVKVICKK